MFSVVRSAAELSRCRSHLLSRGISLVATRSDIANARESCRIKQALYEEQLVSAMNMGELRLQCDGDEHERGVTCTAMVVARSRTQNEIDMGCCVVIRHERSAIQEVG